MENKPTWSEVGPAAIDMMTHLTEQVLLLKDCAETVRAYFAAEQGTVAEYKAISAMHASLNAWDAWREQKEAALDK